jgi:hypothetical protein
MATGMNRQTKVVYRLLKLRSISPQLPANIARTSSADCHLERKVIDDARGPPRWKRRISVPTLRVILCEADFEVVYFLKVAGGRTVCAGIFMRSLFRNCAIPCAIQIYRIADSDGRGGEGYRTVPKPDGPNPDGFGPCFSVLIMSKAQMGLILCKLSEELRRYERTMDQSNGSRDPNHSHRKETMGSTAAARRAGNHAASAVTAAMPAVAAMKIMGSKGLI